MGNIYYRQCDVRQKGTGFTRTTWLPEKYAKMGMELRLMGVGDKKTEGWIVCHVSQTRMIESEVVDRSQDYKRTRKASDI